MTASPLTRARSLCALALLAFIGVASWGIPAGACSATTPCRVANGYYLVRTPSGWDGRSPMPAVLFFHGYRESAESTMAFEDLTARMDKLGVLLIAAHGEGNTWAYPGSPSQLRNDFDYVRTVLEDVEKRFPVDYARLIASGFSQGASMTWYLACVMGDRFAGFAPISGAFWRPHPTECPSGPVNMLHVHGTNDFTVPMEGRALRGGAFRQGDVREGLKLFLKNNECGASASAVSVGGGLACEIWRGCGWKRREIQLCTHPGGHDLDARWVEDAVRWMDARSRRD